MLRFQLPIFFMALPAWGHSLIRAQWRAKRRGASEGFWSLKKLRLRQRGDFSSYALHVAAYAPHFLQSPPHLGALTDLAGGMPRGGGGASGGN